MSPLLDVGPPAVRAPQGPTGHGKTTLLQMLGGLDRPTSGIVDLDGQDLAQMRESQVTKVRATSIGFIFQTFNLVPTLSAQENAEAALVPMGIRAADRRARAAKSLAGVRLRRRAPDPPAERSGGPRQRVGPPPPPGAGAAVRRRGAPA